MIDWVLMREIQSGRMPGVGRGVGMFDWVLNEKNGEWKNGAGSPGGKRVWGFTMQ